MEKQRYYLLIILIALVICVGVFWFQYNNDVSTFIIINETEVEAGGSFSGMLMDSYSIGVANKTITYQKPGPTGEVEKITTNDEGGFIIKNAEYLPESNNNYYYNFSFAGEDRFQGCIYEGNVTVINS